MKKCRDRATDWKSSETRRSDAGIGITGVVGAGIGAFVGLIGGPPGLGAGIALSTGAGCAHNKTDEAERIDKEFRAMRDHCDAMEAYCKGKGGKPPRPPGYNPWTGESPPKKGKGDGGPTTYPLPGLIYPPTSCPIQG